jgi:DNA repair exonuclease SbcCD ATPase subunit
VATIDQIRAAVERREWLRPAEAEALLAELDALRAKIDGARGAISAAETKSAQAETIVRDAEARRLAAQDALIRGATVRFVDAAGEIEVSGDPGDMNRLIAMVNALRERAERAERERDEVRVCCHPGELCELCLVDAEGMPMLSRDELIAKLDALRERAERAERELHSEKARLSIYISKLYSEAQVAPLRKVRDAAADVIEAYDWDEPGWRDEADGHDVYHALRLALDAARGEVGG